MAFLLRSVSTSAQGREIVRTTRIEGDRLTIGRDPSNDVRLTDLAVALHHARVARVGDHLTVTAEPGLFVALNGKQVPQGVVELGSGGDLRIGSHLLRFPPTPADSGEVAVSIEQASAGETKLDRDAEHLFSLGSVLPGKRAMAWLLVALIVVFGLALPIKAWHDRQQRSAQFARFQADEIWSAGHLSRAHADLQHNCSACHVTPFESVRDTACLACHKDVHGHADPFRLARARPHQSGWTVVQLSIKKMFNLPPGRCIDCHREHEGAQAMPPTPQPKPPGKRLRKARSPRIFLRSKFPAPNSKPGSACLWGSSGQVLSPPMARRGARSRVVVCASTTLRSPTRR